MSFGNFGDVNSLYRQPPRGPVWQTREDLLMILDQYRQWYAEGRSDVEISALIRAKYTVPHNPQSRFPRGKKR